MRSSNVSSYHNILQLVSNSPIVWNYSFIPAALNGLSLRIINGSFLGARGTSTCCWLAVACDSVGCVSDCGALLSPTAEGSARFCGMSGPVMGPR